MVPKIAFTASTIAVRKDIEAAQKRMLICIPFKALSERAQRHLLDVERKRKAAKAIENLALLDFADEEPPLKERENSKYSCKFLDLEAEEDLDFEDDEEDIKLEESDLK